MDFLNTHIDLGKYLKDLGVDSTGQTIILIIVALISIKLILFILHATSGVIRIALILLFVAIWTGTLQLDIPIFNFL